MRKLTTRSVVKPWGRTDLPAPFAAGEGERVGEIWFEAEDQAEQPLLVKYIFTSERLSVQVHPDDAQAQARGLPRGKEECWYILDCAPDAVLGLGLKHPVSADVLKQAAWDGSITDLIDWKPVRPGQCWFVPAGTIHAIGGNIVLAEIQQNSDVTYRLYDYGRPRELHLDDGMAVSKLIPYPHVPVAAALGTSAKLVVQDAPFKLDLVHWAPGAAVSLPSTPAWFLPLSGTGTIDGEAWEAGECWMVDANCALTITNAASGLLAVATR